MEIFFLEIPKSIKGSGIAGNLSFFSENLGWLTARCFISLMRFSFLYKECSAEGVIADIIGF